MNKSFIIVTVENNKIGNVEEVQAAQLAHQHEGLANLLVKHNVDLVIAGGIGGGALMGLQQCGLKVIKEASGEYRDVVQSYIDGKLKDKNESCNHHCEH